MKHLSGDFHDKVNGLINVDGCMADDINVRNCLPNGTKKRIYKDEYAVEYEDGSRDVLPKEELLKRADICQRALIRMGRKEYNI